MSQPINIAKVKTTRGGYAVHIYQVFGDRIFGRFLHGEKWFSMHWRLDGWCRETQVKADAADLVEEKTWRAWRKNDKKPKKIMVRWKAGAEDDDDTIIDIEKRNVDSLLEQLFNEAIWIHEDKSETFCGIEE